MRLVILGGPGAGKGTQSHKLSQRLQVPGISTGNLLREAIASQNPLGKEAEPYLNKGELLPDPMMINFMRSRLVQPDCERGWILEGYPRTAFQAEELDFLLEDLEQPLTCAVYLEISEKSMIERSLVRSLVDDQPDFFKNELIVFKKELHFF